MFNFHVKKKQLITFDKNDILIMKTKTDKKKENYNVSYR